MDRDGLVDVLYNPHVKAFLRAIRQGESNQEDSAYRLENGGRILPVYAVDHPSKGLKSPPGRAFGAYQFLASTWANLCKQYGFEDMTPRNQDLGAIALIAGRGALDEILAGDVEKACRLLHTEWTSLPGGSEQNQNTAKVLSVYNQWLRQFTRQEDAPEPETIIHTIIEPPPVKESTMFPLALLPAIISAFGPAISQLIPQVSKLFDQSEVAKRNTDLASTVINTIVDTAGKPDVQTAIAAMQEDPATAAAVRAAVLAKPEIVAVLEIGGGLQKAREFSLSAQTAERPFWYNPTFWITLILLPMAYYIVLSVMAGGAEGAPWWVGTAFTQETRAGVVSLVIGMVLGGIVGIWFGTSYGSMKKDEIRAASTRSTDKETP